MAVDTDVLAVVVRPPMVHQSHLRQTVWTRRLSPSALETKPVPAQTASSTMHAGAQCARAFGRRPRCALASRENLLRLQVRQVGSRERRLCPSHAQHSAQMESGVAFIDFSLFTQNY